MKIDLPARTLAQMQQSTVQTGKPAGAQSEAGGFSTMLNEMQGQEGVSPFQASESSETGDSPWVPWTEEELSKLSGEGVPEWEIQALREFTFPEVAAERWMRVIAPFLNEAALPDAKVDYITAGRAKCPFLDWVLSGKDPVEYFRQAGKLSPPLHQVAEVTAVPLTTTVPSPVTLTAAVAQESKAAETRAPSPRSVESAPTFVGAELQATRNAPGATQESSSRAESCDSLEQPPTESVSQRNTPAEAVEIKPGVVPPRNLESYVGPSPARNIETTAAVAATVVASALRDTVEATTRTEQRPGSKPGLITGSGPVVTGLQNHEPSPRLSAQPAVTRDTQLFMSELAERIQVQVRQGGNDIRVQLKPANLGHVEIVAQTGSEGLVARIVTESSAVRQYLENNLHVLEQALVDQGLRMDRIDVVAQGYLDARQSSAQPDQHYGGSGYRPDGDGRDTAAVTPVAAEEDSLAEYPLRPAIGPNSTFHTVA